MEQQLALLILGDLDPYPPELTRRASPPPEVRRAVYPVSADVGNVRNNSPALIEPVPGPPLP